MDNLSVQVQTTMGEYYESIEKVQENLNSLEDHCNTAAHTAYEKIQEMNNKTSFFHNKPEDRLDSAAARIATIVAHHQKQFQDYIESHKNELKAQVQQEISDAVQIALDDQITPALEAHINELNSNKEHAIQTIKNMMNDFKKQENSNITSQMSILDTWPEHHDNAPHVAPWKTDVAIKDCNMAEIPPHDSKATPIARNHYGQSTVRTFTINITIITTIKSGIHVIQIFKKTLIENQLNHVNLSNPSRITGHRLPILILLLIAMLSLERGRLCSLEMCTPSTINYITLDDSMQCTPRNLPMSGMA
jgi:hypothetical protein